jgi:hypothetical protein
VGGVTIIALGTLTSVFYAPVTTSLPTSQLTVNTQDQAGRPIAGYAIALLQSGSVVAKSFSPSSLTLNSGQTYTVLADDYGSCHFDHWADTGSTISQRAITISSSTALTAVYSCVTSTINTSTTNSAAAPLTGYYSTLSLSDGTFLQSCFSPCPFTVDNGQYYTITVANYGSETFIHCSDNAGAVDSWGAITS